MICQKLNCVKSASMFPVISVWANLLKNHNPANFSFDDMHTCIDCAAVTKIEEFTTSDGKAKIDEVWKQLGKAPICWETAQLSWKPIVVDLTLPDRKLVLNSTPSEALK